MSRTRSVSFPKHGPLRLPIADELRLVGFTACALCLISSITLAETIVVESVVLQLIDEADLAAGEGGIVVELNVSEGKMVQRGDVITQFGRRMTDSMDTVGGLLESVEPGDVTTISILRVRGKVIYRKTAPIRAR